MKICSSYCTAVGSIHWVEKKKCKYLIVRLKWSHLINLTYELLFTVILLYNIIYIIIHCCNKTLLFLTSAVLETAFMLMTLYVLFLFPYWVIIDRSCITKIPNRNNIAVETYHFTWASVCPSVTLLVKVFLIWLYLTNYQWDCFIFKIQLLKDLNTIF